MDDITEGPSARGGVGTTALGRLHLRVPEGDGFEEVVVERRWPEMSAARAWCERTITKSARGTTVLEIQVFEERWSHARSWETTVGHHPVPEVLQLGVIDAGGGVLWAPPRSMSARAAERRLL